MMVGDSSNSKRRALDYRRGLVLVYLIVAVALAVLVSLKRKGILVEIELAAAGGEEQGRGAGGTRRNPAWRHAIVVPCWSREHANRLARRLFVEKTERVL